MALISFFGTADRRLNKINMALCQDSFLFELGVKWKMILAISIDFIIVNCYN